MKTIKNTALFGTLALFGALTPGHAAPTVITTALGRGADLNVRGGAFAAGNHSTNLLRVRNSANLQDARKMYLRFDLSTLPKPVKNATGAMMGLQMLAPEGHSPPGKVWTFNVSGMKDGLADENWDEKTVTWNNAPLSDTNSGLTLSGDALPLGTFSINGTGTPGQKVTFSSPAFTKFLQSDSNGEVTLIITRQETGVGAGEDVTHIFAPKEHAPDAPPMLSVAFNGENPALPGTPPAVKTNYSLPTTPVPDGAPAAKEMNDFWEADKKQLPPQNAVLFIGSSSVRIWSTLAQDFAEIPVINRGFGGSFIRESTLYADRIAIPYKPKIVVLIAGTNDLAYGGENPEQVFGHFKEFVAKIHGALPDTRIIYVSINPTVARWNQEGDILETNHLIEKFIFENGKTQKLNFINSHSEILTADGQPQPALLQQDGLHFNPEGYKVWTSILKPRIMALAAMDGVQRLNAPATR